jgi:hypothetical protein
MGDLAKLIPTTNPIWTELKLWDCLELTLERSTCDHFHDVVKRFFMILFDSVGWKAFRQTGPIVVDD